LTLTIFLVATRRTPGTRAKDSDRTDTCQLLDNALAEGQLSMEEHRQRVSAATNATTLGQLAALVADLQAAPAPPFVTPRLQQRGYRAVMVAVVGVLAVCVIAIGWLVSGNDDSPQDAATSEPSAEATQTHALAAEPTTTVAAPGVVAPEEPAPVVLAPPRELHTAEGMAGVIDEIRKRFGDTMGYELAITPDEATLARPDPADDHSKLIYSFQGGWGDPSTRTRSDTDEVADIGAFDVQAAAAALAAAPETLRIAPGDVSKTLIDIDHVAEPPGPGALELLVKVTTTAGADGWIYFDGAGNIKRVEYPS
jgi:hypothetical protein